MTKNATEIYLALVVREETRHPVVIAVADSISVPGSMLRCIADAPACTVQIRTERVKRQNPLIFPVSDRVSVPGFGRHRPETKKLNDLRSPTEFRSRERKPRRKHSVNNNNSGAQKRDRVGCVLRAGGAKPSRGHRGYPGCATRGPDGRAAEWPHPADRRQPQPPCPADRISTRARASECTDGSCGQFPACRSSVDHADQPKANRGKSTAPSRLQGPRTRVAWRAT